MRTANEILADLRKAALGAPELVSTLTRELERSFLVPDDMTSEAFRQLATMLQDPDYLKTPDTWQLLSVLRLCWDLLSAEQREQMRSILEAACSNPNDPTGAMVVAEILGDRFCDEQSLEQLIRLAANLPMPGRALMPHGLERFARTTKDARLRQLCLDQLRALQNDQEPQVRDEAQLSWDNCHRPS